MFSSGFSYYDNQLYSTLIGIHIPRTLPLHLHFSSPNTKHSQVMNLTEDVVVAGVGEVGEEVVDGTGAGGDGLREATHDGNHGEAAVSDLLALELLSLLGVLGVAHGVEEALRVADVGVGVALVGTGEGILVHGAGGLHVLPAADLGPVHHGHLHEEQGTGAEPVAVPLAGIDPVGEVGHADLGEELGADHAGEAEHRPAAVHELSLDEPLEVLGIRAEVEGIETVVAGEGAVEVSGRGGAGKPGGAGRGDRADAHGGASLGGNAAGADGAGLLGEPGGELLSNDGRHLDLYRGCKVV
mmetsp:Transcript_1303/g.5658  ORF Transcript_1303/g.5658 Transcript_1303/m.5658 type:complete len:298 (+) Transcript_1303:483-1376(+)